jgi:predicted O-linked N-acetylglucosamine transferase (SPINDLY family)
MAKLVPAMTENQQIFGQAADSFNTGKIAEAETLLRRLLASEPDHPDGLHLLGHVALAAGHLEGAAELIGRAIQIRGDIADYWDNLGIVFTRLHRLEDAVTAFRRAVALRPDFADAYYNLGLALFDLGRMSDSIDVYKQALALSPHVPEILNNLGNALFRAGQIDESVIHLRHAISVDPAHFRAFGNLGNSLWAQGHMTEAIAVYRKTLALHPDDLSTLNNLAGTLRETGDLAGALDCYKKARRIEPLNSDVHSNYIYTLHCVPGMTPQEILKEQKEFDRAHAQPTWPAHDNDRNPDRRLRIGYVSADFRDHVAGWNLLAIFQRHNQQDVEICCYSNGTRTDPITDRLKSLASRWHSIAALKDDRAAGLIRADKVDILIDLSMHSAHNRLPLFGRKPAPVQISYLGYCGAAGLSTIDYRFSDPYLDDAQTEKDYLEKTLYLPQSYWCYQPAGQSPEPGPPPADAKGQITFGCLNNFAKDSLPAQALWAKILRQVKDSRLLIYSQPGEHLKEFTSRFSSWGVQSNRVESVGRQTWEQYMARYNQIDIALDPYPYGGGITTCDALWMGTPVISLVGNLSVGRSGKSILSNVGLPELVAQSEKQYQTIAVDLANNLPRLRELRSGLRARMSKSPLTDAAKFTRDLESAYRKVWRTWCQGV